MTTASARLWVARHAPAVDTTMCYGRTDIAVNLHPDVAAERLLASYQGRRPARIWTSPASRCRLVAEQLAASLGLPLVVEDALAELHFGAWEGRPWAEIQTADRAAFEAWGQDWERVPPPGGERPLDIEARVRRWFLELAPDGVDWVIAHSGVVRALSVVIERYTWPDAMRREVPHLAWTAFAGTVGAGGPPPAPSR